MSGPELHRGKLARHPRILSVRPLEREDLARLREKRVGPPRVKMLRRQHHRVARLIALGYRDPDIARLSGYTISRITSLKADPAVQELIATFDRKVEEDFESKIDNIHEEMCEVKLRALTLVQDRIDLAMDDENPSPIALKELVSLFGEMADRTGHGKHSTVRNENVNFAEMMKQLARSSGRSNVIDAKAETRLSPAVHVLASITAESAAAPTRVEGSASSESEGQPDLPDHDATGFLRRA